MIIRFFTLYILTLIFLLLFLYMLIRTIITSFQKTPDKKILKKQIISCIVFFILSFVSSNITPEVGPIGDIWITILSHILAVISLIFLLLSLYMFVKAIITPFQKIQENKIKIFAKQIINCIIFLLISFFFLKNSEVLTPYVRAIDYFHEGKTSYLNSNYQEANANLERSLKLLPNGKHAEEAKQILNQIKQEQDK